MMNSKKISLVLVVVGILLCATESRAQVSATATVTLTILPAPGMTFNPVVKAPASTSAFTQPRISENAGVTFQSTGNVMVQLNTLTAGRSKINFSDGEARTFTAKELKNVSSVEIVYLGS